MQLKKQLLFDELQVHLIKANILNRDSYLYVIENAIP